MHSLFCLLPSWATCFWLLKNLRDSLIFAFWVRRWLQEIGSLKKYHWCPITKCIWLLQATVSKDHQWEGLGGQCQIEKGNATFPVLFTKSNSYNAVTNNTSVTPELQNDWVQVKHMQLDPVYVCNHYWTTVQHY